MGLPIWRDPEEKKSRRSAPKPDPTACLRSSIRRRPSVHGRRPARLPREPTFPPRFERSPGWSYRAPRTTRRGEERGVPPISTLLETADRDRTALPSVPFPVPDSRNYTLSASADDEQDRQELEAQRRLAQRLQLVRDERRRSRISHIRRQYDRGVREDSRAMSSVPDGPVDIRRSPTPPANRDDPSQPMHTITLNPGEPLRIIRSPEPILGRSRPQSRNGTSSRNRALPTPPLDTSGPEDRLSERLDDDSDEFTTAAPRQYHRSHPLSQAWRASPPINGLGDRNRSPTPADGWDIMGTTIAPDETLPSADSSFASTTASRSFNASGSNSTGTHITFPDEQSDDSDDDLVCTDEDMFSTEVFAEDVYYQEIQTPEGRERIASHQLRREQEGNRFALEAEPARVDIGFRIIEEALETEEGRQRVLQIRQGTPTTRQVRLEPLLQDRRTNEPQRPQPERYGEDTHNVVRQTSRQVHDYFRRFDGEALEQRSTSPPPEYEAPAPPGDAGATTSPDEAENASPHRMWRETSARLFQEGVQDRRIVERLAGDDFPEEWWMRMGLNFSRTQPRNRSPGARRSGDANAAWRDSPRTGRIERGNSRL